MHSIKPELFDVITISYGRNQQLIGGVEFAKICYNLVIN